LGATFKVGWNLGEEFVNMYLGYADTFFDGNMPAVNNANGYETLKMLKKLTEYMDPEYLNSDSTYVQQQFQQGKIAMANLWASRAGAMDNAEESSVVGLVKFASAPSVKRGGKPASTLWWDGVVIAKNISDEEAEAAFKLAMVGLDPANLGANPEAAPWISNAFDPAPSNIGAVMTAKGGAAPYPASAQMSTLHGVLGNVLPDYLTGAATAKATLEKIEADYITAATEKGLL
jgi:ABC-type glycerol-3-phosphate transport system substrate-binding protein